MVEESKERVCCCFAGWQPEPPLPRPQRPSSPPSVSSASRPAMCWVHQRNSFIAIPGVPHESFVDEHAAELQSENALTDLSPSHRQLVFHPPPLLAALPCDEHGTRCPISPARLSAMTRASVQRHVQMGRLYAPSTESSSSPQTLSPICCVLLPPCRSPSPRTPSKSSSESL